MKTVVTPKLTAPILKVVSLAHASPYTLELDLTAQILTNVFPVITAVTPIQSVLTPKALSHALALLVSLIRMAMVQNAKILTSALRKHCITVTGKVFCTNTDGGFECSCECEGYTDNGIKLSVDGDTGCMDIDECSNGDATFFDNSSCKNTDGSYKCKCNDGFILNDDGTACNDVDECTDGTDTCDAATQEC